MQRADWERIERVCGDALELAPGERAAFLHAACNGNESLLREVQSLLDQINSEPGFLEQPAIERGARSEEHGLQVGDTIGVYRLERLLGRGGMGEVYLASRNVDGIAQQVALKIIRRGMNTDEVLQRFRLERRILASLHHANVAALIDAGATIDGRPYFVMEYVDGQPLTEYCDSGRLSITDRLRLFQRICSAVHHSHQQLVVHRDIKPRNILVDASGMPKLLDFGIGKVLAEGDSFGTAFETRTEMRLLTPEYAAPEQVTGGNVTTATDVYSLGVVLYELLTGRLPYAIADTSRASIERALTESAPLRPSISIETPETTRRGTAPTSSAEAARVRNTDVDGLRRRLSGDLDTIVLMALRKEPDRRYASASALADDIQRHLDNLPVSARPDTLGYRLRKFAERNTGGVVGAGAVLVALVAITTVSVVQSRRVIAEAARTAHERDKAVEVRGFLMEMFGATGADQAVGDTVSVRALLDRQRAQLDAVYAGRNEIKADMLDVLADGYDRLGLYADAEPLAKQALELRRTLLPATHPDVATSLNLLAWIQHERGQSAQAETLLLEAARIRRGYPENAVNGLSRSLNDLGVVYNALRRYPDAERVLREALDIRQRVFGESHRTVGITASNLAASLYFQQRVDSAIPLQEIALRSLQASVGPEHQRTVVALSNLAAFKRAKGDFAAAEKDYRELAARQTRLQGRQHPVTARVLTSLASVIADRATLEKRTAPLVEAESLYREALTAFELRLGPTHVQTGQQLDRLAGVLLAQQRPREAIPLETRALTILRATAADTSRTVQQAAERLARAHEAIGDTAGATAVARRFNLKRVASGVAR